MKSPSKNINELNAVEFNMNTVLDDAVADFSDTTLCDIATVRNKALSKMTHDPVSKTLTDRFSHFMAMPFIKLGMPLAIVFIGALLLKNHSVDQIPELPIALLTTEMPSENFTLLEDLEFVIIELSSSPL